METARAVHVRINRRMVVKILAIIDRCVLDLANLLFDLFDSALLLVVNAVRRRGLVEMRAGVAQICQRVKVSRMLSRFIRQGECGAHCNNKQNCGAMSYGLHRLLVSVQGWPFGRKSSR